MNRELFLGAVLSPLKEAGDAHRHTDTHTHGQSVTHTCHEGDENI